ncbi:MAG: hypothetical protein DME59_19685 [Verrucomicrobia bacterium]|nr:MAG: hypothetical protein DME59_19685 [Verrucomicrobiota bacterium]
MITKILNAIPFLTTKHWRGFSVPLSREKTKSGNVTAGSYTFHRGELDQLLRDSHEVRFESVR